MPVRRAYSTAASKVPGAAQTAHGFDGKLRKSAAADGAVSRSGCQPADGSRWHEAELGAGERDPRGVVGVVGIGEQDPVAALGQRECELDDRRLRARDDGHLAVGIELDAVVRAVAPAIARRSAGSPRNGA